MLKDVGWIHLQLSGGNKIRVKTIPWGFRCPESVCTVPECVTDTIRRVPGVQVKLHLDCSDQKLDAEESITQDTPSLNV